MTLSVVEKITDPDKVLTDAVGKLDSVLVLGWDKQDHIYISSDSGSIKEMLWLLEGAKHVILSDVLEGK